LEAHLREQEAQQPRRVPVPQGLPV
jgi:hypothetical protein